MSEYNKYIRFDWAVKRMLRDKANFAVLEGLVTVLIGTPIKILEILESEGNQENASDKFNRVDIKAKTEQGEIIIVEVQLTRQLYYLQRMLYGVSKAITEHIEIGDKYDKVKKVYSINILYFDLGQGSDYLYHGKTVFKGVHTGDMLKVNTREQDEIKMKVPEDVFPEYFIIRINNFNDVATTPIEEWIDYLKNGRIKEDTSTPGLQEARKKLQYISMNEKERHAYEAHMDDIMVQNDVLDTAKMEGREEGRAEGREEGRAEGREEGRAEGREEGRAEGREEGRAEGRAEGREEGREEGRTEEKIDIARKMKDMGMSAEVISKATGVPAEVIKDL